LKVGLMNSPGGSWSNFNSEDLKRELKGWHQATIWQNCFYFARRSQKRIEDS